MRYAVLSALLLSLLVTACTSLPTSRQAQGVDRVQQLVQQYGYGRHIYPTPFFNHLLLTDVQPSCTAVSLYLEGDGYAWVDAHTPSADPTPSYSPLLRAFAQAASCKVYLARPCQYVDSAYCQPYYWTVGRFAKEVIASSDAVMTQLSQELNITQWRLHAYSGGATVAAILADTRQDVAALTTYMGNLNHQAWTDYHQVTPLYASLNAIQFTQSIRYKPQRHYIGLQDKVIPNSIIESYLQAQQQPAQVEVIEWNVGHDDEFLLVP